VKERGGRGRDHVVMTGTSVACLLKIRERAARNLSPASYAYVVHPLQAAGFGLVMAKISLMDHIDEVVATIARNVRNI
jgi:hypothetical protein